MATKRAKVIAWMRGFVSWYWYMELILRIGNEGKVMKCSEDQRMRWGDEDSDQEGIVSSWLFFNPFLRLTSLLLFISPPCGSDNPSFLSILAYYRLLLISDTRIWYEACWIHSKCQLMKNCTLETSRFDPSCKSPSTQICIFCFWNTIAYRICSKWGLKVQPCSITLAILMGQHDFLCILTCRLIFYRTSVQLKRGDNLFNPSPAGFSERYCNQIHYDVAESERLKSRFEET